MKIVVIFTCYNRKQQTESCIRAILSGNSDFDFSFVIVDDHSTDGTGQLLKELKKRYNMHILQGSGELFYSGGMHMGMQYALGELDGEYDYVLLINDDVLFFDHFLEKMVRQSQSQSDAVIVGAMRNHNEKLSYGALKHTKGVHFRRLGISEWETPADTFEANCVLLPLEAFQKTGAMDGHYLHSLGDLDYGMQVRRNGIRIHTLKEYAGICDENPTKGTWTDTSLPRLERIRRKESAKGAPVKQWFYFLRKNFGLFSALWGCVTPYIRILIRR